MVNSPEVVLQMWLVGAFGDPRAERTASTNAKLASGACKHSALINTHTSWQVWTKTDVSYEKWTVSSAHGEHKQMKVACVDACHCLIGTPNMMSADDTTQCREAYFCSKGCQHDLQLGLVPVRAHCSRLGALMPPSYPGSLFW